MVRIKRIFHHFEKWEEVGAGMWDYVSAKDEKSLLSKAVQFTGDAESYGSFMMRVVNEWPFSCEQAFTNPGMNHLAWVGHAACCLAIGCPEYIVRRAWGMLNEQQQNEANGMARQAVQLWLYKYRSRGGQLVLL